MKKRLKELRKEHLKISQQKIANKLNISQATYGRYETGELNPTDRTIADICREFNVNEDWLRTGEGSIFKEMSEREEKILKIHKALEGRSDSLIHSLYCLADMEPEEIRLLIDIGFKIIDLNRNEEFRKRINSKNVTKSVTTPLQDKK